MAPYSSALAWEIPWTEDPGRLQSAQNHLSAGPFSAPGPGPLPTSPLGHRAVLEVSRHVSHLVPRHP